MQDRNNLTYIVMEKMSHNLTRVRGMQTSFVYYIPVTEKFNPNIICPPPR